MYWTIGLAEDFLNDYIQVNIGSLELCANHNITQIVEVCPEYAKEEKYAYMIHVLYIYNDYWGEPERAPL